MDRTVFFRKCVAIYEDSLDHTQTEVTKKRNVESCHLKNSEFYINTSSIHQTIASLTEILNTARPQYLLSNSRVMSEEQKALIDTEYKVKIQRLTQRIKNLQDVSTKLKIMEASSDELTYALKKVGFPISKDKYSSLQSLTRNLISMGDYSDYAAIRNDTLRTIFSNVVKILGLELQKIMLLWNEMHNKRMERLNELKKSSLSTSASSKSNNPGIHPSNKQMDHPSVAATNIKVVSEEYEEIKSELPQKQLLQLQEEQHSLIEQLKRETIDQVSQIEESMMDVASMVREIGVQLSMQNDNISLLDVQKDTIMSNVKSGNTVLIKANESNSKRNKTFAWLIFLAALILLAIDYIL